VARTNQCYSVAALNFRGLRPPHQKSRPIAARSSRAAQVFSRAVSTLDDLLARYGFDLVTFERLKQRLAATGDLAAGNILHGKIEPPAPGDLVELPAEDSAAHAALRARGEAALAAGEVGVVVLAGGMATRWGGGVKAVVEALAGRSFLSLKLDDVRRTSQRLGARIPIYIIASFCTHDAIADAIADAARPLVPIELVPQFVSMRVFRDGSIVREADGQPSLYATGHGDLPFALRRSGALGRFLAGGGKTLFMSNVDNLAATLDPAVIGAHTAQGRAITVEVVRAEPGDKGGAPARVDGQLQIVEGFRFPADFPIARLPTFNTNTFTLDAGSLDRDFPLSWFSVSKQVGGREVVQFERLVGELTAFLPATYLVVPRQPPYGRFQPAKDPEELAAGREALRAILTKRGVLAP
jgi:UTP--glucose-1-phosphate uridylyltransferase